MFPLVTQYMFDTDTSHSLLELLACCTLERHDGDESYISVILYVQLYVYM